jgi:response regulator RpfG family c-di-GMP phosphodiesterase
MDKIKILVVDDEEHICKMVLRFLSMNNYRGDSAKNGKKALDMLAKNKYDIVLTDIKMPEMDGISLMKVAKDTYPDLIFIIMSAYGTLESAIESMKMGAINFIKKPISIVELISTIKKAEDFIFSKSVHLKVKDYIIDINKSVSLTTKELHQNLDMMVNYLTTELRDFGAPKASVDNLTLALYEALTNAIEHGNLKLDKSITRDHTIEIFDNFLKDKLKKLEDPALAGKLVLISFRFSKNEMEFTITDEGNGFDYKRFISDVESNIYTDKLNKGLFLIKHVVNKLEFNEKGNQIKMTIKVN